MPIRIYITPSKRTAWILKSIKRILTRMKLKALIAAEKITTMSPKAITNEEDKSMIQPYLNKIWSAVSDCNVTNIAITGAYGSGKSTVIKTFQKEYYKEKYINISLASFVQKIKSDNKNDDNSDNKFDDKTHECMSERDIELSILQQIFYQVKSSKIPFSRFKRIKSFSTCYLIRFSLCLTLWIYSLIIILSCTKFNLLNPVNWFPSFSFNWTGLVLTLIVIVGLIYLIGKIISIIANSKINKVNIRGEIGLCDRLDKSVFNEYLEEILYFFERTNYNIVVLEDIDRFNSIEIFTKLRELNILINNCAAIKQQVKFIYAIKDEIFKDKSDRVKFFDYIIPIISFINPQSAKEQLSKLIDENKLKDILSPEFTNRLVFYIDDIEMRLLVCIFNEYIVYKHMLNDNSLKQENLFAIVTYKILFPEDFGKLQHRKGVLYEFVSHKNLYIIDEIEKEIEEVEKEIKDINDENNKQLKKLRLDYLGEIKEMINRDIEFLVLDNKQIHFSEMSSKENFDLLLNQPYYKNIEYINFDGQETSNINFENVEDAISISGCYNKDRAEILYKHNNKIDNLKTKLKEKKTKKNELMEMSLKDVIKETSLVKIENIFYRKKIEKDSNWNKIIFKNELMCFLLSEGYIDENFFDYITLFYAVNITKEDKTFITNVKAEKSSSYETILPNAKEVIDELPNRYFKKKYILNFSLLNELLKGNICNNEKLEAVITLLSNNDESSSEFIQKYINENIVDETNNVSRFINLLNNKIKDIWQNLWKFLIINNKARSQKVSKYLEILVKNLDTSKLIELDSEKMLSKTINETPRFINLFDDNSYGKVTALLRQLEIKFIKIEDPEKIDQELINAVFQRYLQHHGNYSLKMDKEKLEEYIHNLSQYKLLQNNDVSQRNEKKLGKIIKERQAKYPNILLKYIYDNNHYEININNLSLLIDKFVNIKSHSFETSNYTSILNSEETKLKEYVESNLKTYVNEVFLKLKKNKNENESSILKLLNNEKLDLNEKKAIIDKEINSISDIKNICDYKIQQVLFFKNKIKATWENILSYFGNNELETIGTIIEYISISSNLKKLSKQKLGLSDENSNLINTLFFSDKLNAQTYHILVKSINGKFNKFESKDLETEKVKSVIYQDKLRLNLYNYRNLKEHNHYDSSIELIEKEHDKFDSEIIEHFDEYDLSLVEILFLLHSESLSQTNKLKLLIIIESTSNEIISKKYSPKYIFIQSSKDDAPTLKNYSQKHESFKSLIDAPLLNSKHKNFNLFKNIINAAMLDDGSTANNIIFIKILILDIVKKSEDMPNSIRVINLYYKNFTDSEKLFVINSLKGDYLKILKGNDKKIEFEQTDYNKELFTHLRELGLIQSYKSLKNGKIRVNCV